MSANIYSTDAFELILGVSSGEIGGVAGETVTEKLQNVFINDTPVFDSSGVSNFTDSEVILRFEPGTPFTAIEDAEEGQTPIWYAFGGKTISVSVDQELSYQSEITELTPVTANGFDAIELRFYIPQLARYTSDGTKKHELSLKLQYRKVGEDTWFTQVKTIEGKATVGPITRSFKFSIPRTTPEERYEIRVTKQTFNSTDKKVANVSWVGYELITNTGNTYTSEALEYTSSELEYHPGTAMLQIVGVLGEQISNIPSVSAIYDGILCAVPSNYDPVTKVYDESTPWDGTFKPKKEFTDNPLWIAHELATNTIFGIARFNPRVRVNRYSVYEKAKYADGYNLTTNTKDLTNPLTGEEGAARYTFNAVIESPREGMELLNYVLGTAFARAVDADDGEIHFLMDLPTVPVATITPEMCVDFSESSPFTYSYSDLESRYNALTSSYIDASQEYQPRYVGEIRDQAAIDKYGLNVHEFKALGCTNEWECQRKMYFFLASVQNEKTTVTFRVPLHGIEYETLDVINLVDPNAGNGLSGRMVGQTNNSITLRDALYFDVAGTYDLTLQGIDQDYTFQTTITEEQVGLGLFTFVINGQVPASENYNEYPVVTVSTRAGQETPVGFPKPWRITNIAEIDDERLPDVYEVTATEIDVNKYTNADLLSISVMPDYSFKPSYQPVKVDNLRVLEQEHVKVETGEQVNLWIGWDELKPLPAGGYYEVFITENSLNGQRTSFRVQQTSFEVPNISRGEIEVVVVTHFGGKTSAEASITYDTSTVLASEMAAQSASPSFNTSFENDELRIETKLEYSYGSSTENIIDLIATKAISAVRYTIFDDRDPQSRIQLLTRETTGLLVLTAHDFAKAVGHTDYVPSSLFVEVLILDREGDVYPISPSAPFTLAISNPVQAIDNLSYNRIYTGVESHRVTWDDNNYGYEVTVLKPDGKSHIAKQVIYENEISLGALPLGVGYVVQVRGFNSNREFGNPKSVTFNVEAEITPTAEPTISNEDGTIIVTPPPPVEPQSEYQFKYSAVDNISNAKSGNKGLSTTISGTINGANYYVWYRLLSIQGKGSWVKKTIVAVGQVLYTWKVFADDENGSNISISASGKPFVGILSGQLTATPDISDPSVYAWLRNTSTEWLFGTGVPSNAVGNIGDSYLEQSTGNIYKKSASGWDEPIGNLQGGDGDKFWSSPYAPDSAENPYTGSDGDIYINTSTFEIFQKINGTWTLKGVLKGADGAPGADGVNGAFFVGFETETEQNELVVSSGVSKEIVTDAFSGNKAVKMSSIVVNGETTGSGETAYLTIPEALALMFAGQRCVISVVAKQGSTDGSTSFGLAYSTSDVGNSGYSTFTPTSSFKKYSFEYVVPLPTAGGTDFLILNPDLTGSGGTLIVDHVQVTIKGEQGAKGDQGPAPTIVDNGDGSYTITGSNGSITIYDGNDAPIPTVTDNGDGTYTIDNGAGETVTVSDGQDGYTPEKGVDYFDGLNGDYVSFIYKNSASKPATPTGGSFNGTTETFPSGWSDTKQAVPAGQLRWVSMVRYKNNLNGTYSQRTSWKEPAEDFEKGEQGVPGQDGADGKDGINASAVVSRPGQTWNFKDGLQGWSLRNGDATYPNGKIRFVGTGNDAGIVSPVLSINGATDFAVVVKIRTVSATHTTSGEIFYTTPGHGVSVNHFKGFDIEFKQDEWTYIVADMRDLNQGGDDYITSEIKQLRVDFSNAANGRIYEIDTVTIGYFGAADETDYGDDRINNDVLQPPGIAYGAAGTIYLVKNSNASLTEGSASGEIGVSTGAIYLPDNTKIVFGSAMQLATPFESNFPHTVGFVIASKQSTQAKLGPTFGQDSYVFTAIYEDGQWKAVDNAATRFAFTPDQNDVVIARIRRNVGGNIEKLESMLTSADITDYSDNRISNDELTQTQIQYGAGWSTMPASGATRNTGALANRNNIDLSNPGSFLLNRLGINFSNLETLNNRFSLGTDGYLTYTDNSGNPVNVGNVTPEGIGASTLDEMLETSAGGNILPDPTFSKFNNSGRGANYYFSLWGDSGTPRSSATHNGTDVVWTVKASAQSGPGFTVSRLRKLLYIPAKKGDRFAVKVVASSPVAIGNFRAYASERLSNLAYNGRTTNFFNVTLNGTRVILGGIVEVVEDDAAFILLSMRCDIPASDLNITLHSIQLHKMDESFSNDLITIGEDGKLYNGGSQQGQVTADGLGVKTYRVVARGSSSTGVPATPGLYKNGQLVSGIARSYIVATINRSTGDYTARQTFDVYGSAANAQAMADYLNGIGTDVIVVIYTQDEPQRYRLHNGLDAAMYRCGASRAVFGSSEFKSRAAYALIGIPGCGEGNGAEFYQGEINQDPNAWLDAGFQVVNGSITGVSGSYTPKTLKDYGFVGSLDANYVDNTNQLTDGAGLGDTAMWSGVSGDGRPEDYATDTGVSSLIPDPTFDLQKASISGPEPQFYFISNAGEFGDAALAVDGSASRENTTYAWITRRNGEILGVTARAGDTFKIRARVKNEDINSDGIGLNLLPKKSDGGNVGTYPSFFRSGNVPADGNWHTIEATVTIGENHTTTHNAQFYVYCNTSVTSGRFLLDTLEAWKIPASINNDQVDDAFIKERFGWGTAPSDGANKTEVIADSTDGRATLHLDGATKYIDVFSSDSRTRWNRLRQGKMPTSDSQYLNQWASITGTGKPSANANKTEVITDNVEGRATLHLDGVTKYIDVFSSGERTKLNNLRANKLADGSRYILDRDLALLNGNGQSAIDSRANSRVAALRPDASYKNDNIKPAKRWGSGSLSPAVSWLKNHNSEAPPTGTSGKIIVSSIYGGVGFVHLQAVDAEGGIRVSLNGIKIGEMSGDDNETRWYTFKVSNLVAGNNTIYVWSKSADGGNVTDWVITGNAVGDPESLLKSSPDVIDSRANSRISATRPDSQYKNENTTKAQVGLSNVPNYTEAQFNSSAVSASLQEALLRNPSGEGINFFNPLYTNPLPEVPVRSVSRLQTPLVRTDRYYRQPSAGNCWRMLATGNDAFFYMAANSEDFNIKLMPNRQWIVSFMVYRQSANNVPIQVYLYGKEDDGTARHIAGVATVNHTRFSWKRYAVLMNLQTYPTIEDVQLRFDNEGGNGADILIDQIMIEPFVGPDVIPSPYTAPFLTGPVLNAGSMLPMASLAGATATIASINGGDKILDTEVNGTNANIIIRNHTIQLPDKQITYNADILTVSQNVRYFVYCDDPYGIGGSQTYQFVTAAQFSSVSASSGRYWLGSITTASSSNPGGGNPDDDTCVAADMYLREGLLAGDVAVGDVIDAWNPSHGFYEYPVQACPKGFTNCVRLVTKAGAVVVSTTTPIDLKDGRTIHAINAFEEELLTVDENGNEEWQLCTHIEYLPAREVVKINVSDNSYLAGEKASFRIVTHNQIFKK